MAEINYHYRKGMRVNWVMLGTRGRAGGVWVDLH